MTSKTCDSCKKPIPNARRSVNFKTLVTKDLCLDCYDELEDLLKDQMGPRRGKISKMDFPQYKKFYENTLMAMCK